MSELVKYLRTPHLKGSRLQVGDSADGQVSIADLTIGTQVWEEKLDGSNTGISFSSDADLLLQSRGHYLTGGWREKQYNLLKRWASCHQDWLFDRLTDRFIMYGEWCYAKHTEFYDRLPHYFLEFDIYDRHEDCFLDTPARHALLRDGPVVSVPVLHTGSLQTEQAVRGLIQPSLYKSPEWSKVMQQIAIRMDIDFEQVLQETDASSLSEGLYLKVEAEGRVIGRYKFVRSDFLQAIVESGSHWNTRPILPNQLAPGIDIFASVS